MNREYLEWFWFYERKRRQVMTQAINLAFIIEKVFGRESRVCFIVNV